MIVKGAVGHCTTGEEKRLVGDSTRSDADPALRLAKASINAGADSRSTAKDCRQRLTSRLCRFSTASKAIHSQDQKVLRPSDNLLVAGPPTHCEAQCECISRGRSLRCQYWRRHH
jgi:hypothetical protein